MGSQTAEGRKNSPFFLRKQIFSWLVPISGNVVKTVPASVWGPRFYSILVDKFGKIVAITDNTPEGARGETMGSMAIYSSGPKQMKFEPAPEKV